MWMTNKKRIKELELKVQILTEVLESLVFDLLINPDQKIKKIKEI